MRTFSGFDRVSTEEELHQVLDVLGELERNGYLLGPHSPTPQPSELWTESLLDESTDSDSLLDLLEQRPELKN